MIRRVFGLLLLLSLAYGQQPQTSLAPIFAANAKYTQGVGPGYWPTGGAGLVLNVAAGTAFCSNSIVTYAGGTLSLTNNTTNYVYLDTSSSCAPAFNTSGFSSTTIPVAKVVTSGGAITTITDDRTLFFTAGGSGTVTSFSAGNLAPLFTTSVATATTTPALSFALSNAAAHNYFGNNTAGSAAPAYYQPAVADLSDGSTGSGAVVLAGAPTMSNPVVGTQSTTDNSTKAASTAYVTTAISSAIAGVNPAVAVQAATNAILQDSPVYSNGVSGIGATITAGVTNTTLVVDGYTPALLERVLVKNEASGGGLGAAKNGVYYVSQLGALGLKWILTRALDYDQPSDINNTGAIPVVNGTANSTTQWVITSTVNTVGTDALTYVQFSVNPSTIITNSTSAGGDLSGTYPNPTAAKIDATSVPVNSAADQVLQTTASATGAWKSIPNCATDGSSAITYTTSTHTWNCTAIVASSIAGGFAWGGDGSDSSVTADGSTTVTCLGAPSSSIYTMTRDCLFTSLTVNSGVTIKTGNYMIFATGTVTVNGTVMNDGQAGVNGGNASNQVGAALGAAGTQSSTSSVGTFPRTGIGSSAGSNGATGVSGAGAQAAAPGNAGTTTQSYANGGSAGSNGGNGGAGGAGSGGTNAGGAARSGGTGGATPSNSGRLPDARTPLRAITFLSSAGAGGLVYLNSYDAPSGGAAGGSSGGGDGTNLGRGGGGGGGQGGHGGALLIAAKNIVIGASGVISSKGANGGNGGNGGGGAAGNVGGGGGGAGGGGGDGGVVFLIYQSLTNSGSITAAAGSGGTHGTGSAGAGTGASGSNGQDGPNGNAGIVIQIPN